MFDRLEKLRKKPEAYRMRIAFIISISIAGIIFLIWLSALSVRFNTYDNGASDKEKNHLYTE